METVSDSRPLYERVGGEIAAMIDAGTYRVGDRLPSIRQLSSKLSVSINTVMQAYAVLEDRHVIQARPQSGYYVSPRAPEITAAPHLGRQRLVATTATCSELCQQVIRNMMNRDLLPFGSAIPHPRHLPVDKLNRVMASVLRRFGDQGVAYMLPAGYERLRTQIAKRSLSSGFSIGPDQVLITSGCVEAVQLALRATCRPGDTIAVESPFYFNFLLAPHPPDGKDHQHPDQHGQQGIARTQHGQRGQPSGYHPPEPLADNRRQHQREQHGPGKHIHPFAEPAGARKAGSQQQSAEPQRVGHQRGQAYRQHELFRISWKHWRPPPRPPVRSAVPASQ